MTTQPSSLDHLSNQLYDGTSHGLGLLEVQPRKGRLVALRTKAKAQASLQVIGAYVVEIPLESANGVLK